MAGATRQAILDYIDQHGTTTGPELARQFGITRQAVSLHLRQLIASGAIYKTGSTRAARYHARTSTPSRPQSIRRRLNLAGLDEARVYDDLAITFRLGQLPANVESIARYSFTELLNNAIDHSKSDRGNVEATLDRNRFSFSVRDRGIGAFHSIREKLSLEDEHAAMIELIKGKTTTMPQAHSGEGLFFVSRAADRLVLRSHRLEIEWDRIRDDVFVSTPRYLEGTLVSFEILRDSRTRLEKVFEAFAPAEYDFRFQRTRVLVKLLQREYVSRSEAKRLLHSLDKFSEIELDMRDVDKVGQGFTDEIFRVFATAHPGIAVRAVNASPAVEAMIRHVSGSANTDA